MSTQTIDFDLGERVLPRPARRPRRGARALLAAMIALGVALPIFAGVVTLPVQSVRISGEFVRVSKADIERAVEPLLTPGLIRIDVDALRRAALEVAGVREATVRRVWPDRLEISVIERVAVARWASGGYLGSDGTHFAPDGGATADSLPVLAGPEGSHRRVLDLHTALERVLAPLGPASRRHGTHSTRSAVRNSRWRTAPRHAARCGRAHRRDIREDARKSDGGSPP